MRAFAGDSLPARRSVGQSAEVVAEESAGGLGAAAPRSAEGERRSEPRAGDRTAGDAADERTADERTAEPGPATEPAPGTEPADRPEPDAAAEPPRGQTGRLPHTPHVVIVGGGAVGGALAHDLALRGLRVTLLEKAELTSGATGRSQSLLHSGARFAATNRRLATDCVAENKILRRIAPGSFEENDGLFVALTDEDADEAPRFFDACWQAAVPARRLTREEALRSEPGLNPELRFAVRVSDATMDTMRLALRFFATARSNGAEIHHFTEVVEIDVRGNGRGRAVSGVRVRDRATDAEREIGADLVVNAAGPWAGRVAALAGVAAELPLSGGLLVAFRGRHSSMIVNRLHPAADGAGGGADLLVSDRRTTVAGPLSWPVDHPDGAGAPAPGAVQSVRSAAAQLVPSIARAGIRARWLAAMPDNPEAPGACLLIDHERSAARIAGFVTVAGGPATTMRATAQAAADLICRKLSVERPCETIDTILLPHTAWYAE